MEQEQTYQEKKALKQAKKDQDSHLIKNKNLIRKIMFYILGVVIIGIIFYGLFLFSQNLKPKGGDLSQAISIMDTDHISENGLLPTYNSNPPTSGPHYGQVASSGFRTKNIPDQNIIHNLEHGDVWIAYRPGLSDEIKNELKQFDGQKVIITPRLKNDMDIALVAWGRLDTFNIKDDTLEKQRITDFIARYANKGPEKILSKSVGI